MPGFSDKKINPIIEVRETEEQKERREKRRIKIAEEEAGRKLRKEYFDFNYLDSSDPADPTFQQILILNELDDLTLKEKIFFLRKEEEQDEKIGKISKIPALNGEVTMARCLLIARCFNSEGIKKNGKEVSVSTEEDKYERELEDRKIVEITLSTLRPVFENKKINISEPLRGEKVLLDYYDDLKNVLEKSEEFKLAVKLKHEPIPEKLSELLEKKEKK